MYKYFFKIFNTTFVDQIVLYIRPLIHIIPFIFFSKFILNDNSGYIVLGSFIFYIQLDLIIIPNYRYFVLKNENKLFDIMLSKYTANKIIFMESLFYVILLILQLVLFAVIFYNYISAFLIIIISILSLIIGYKLIIITEKNNSFIIVSRIGVVLLTTGSIIYPLAIFPEIIQKILLFNIYTPIMEIIRNIRYDNLLTYSNQYLLTFIIIDIVLYAIILSFIKKYFSK